MYRFSWGNGPLAPDYPDHALPDTACYVADGYAPGVPAFHRRVRYPGQTDWEWYVAYRDAEATEPLAVHGLGIDELHPNELSVPDLLARMTNVDFWCRDKNVAPPQWLLAINPGNPAAVDYTLLEVNASFPGRVWWFVESYIGLYKGEGEDFGLTNARMLLERVAAAGLQSRAIYGINHSHYVPGGSQPGPAYHNVYGTWPTERDDRIYSRLERFIPEVVARGEPFGFGVWTPGYSSVLSRADVDFLLKGVGA